MSKYLVIICFAFGLTACGVSSQAPLDDAYFWPDGNAQIANDQPQITSDQSPFTNSLEVLDENDNSVTVRVKK